MIPDPTLDVSQYLFHHPGVDFIWTTGGPKAVAAANAAGKPCLSVGAGNAPVYIHRSADVPMAVVDMLISKTFDSSVICPAEQTCIVDDAVWDATLAELQRMGARLLSDEEASALAAVSFDDDGHPELAVARPVVRRPRRPRRLLGGRRRQGPARAAAVRPRRARGPPARAREADAGARARPLAVGRARRRAPPRSSLENGGLGHTSAVYATDEAVIDAFATAVRTGRILVNAPTAVGALGGVYNAMTPTFSLGCGTWGGSITTDNINYRNLLNVKAVSRRQTPPQWFRVPSDTYFNPGALEQLRSLRTAQALLVTDADTEARGVADEVRRHLAGVGARVRRGRARAHARSRSAPASTCWRSCGPT